MNYFVIILLLAACEASFAIDLQCSHPEVNIPQDWIDMNALCVKNVQGQIEEEIKASMQYMAMGAFFSKDSINRPGFAKLFFEAASEERDHAIKLISYLLMRGELTRDVSSLIKRNLFPKSTSWANGISALKDALKLEAFVTKKIRALVGVCEGGSFNDYHFVDYLTGDFLNEQYHGSRDIAGKISQLEKMVHDHGHLGEWLFDKKLLNAEM